MLGLIGAIINFIAGLMGFVPKGPSTEQQLGQTQQELKDVEASDAATAKGNAAAGDVSGNLSSVYAPDQYERPGS